MKVVILNSYHDKGLDRIVKVGEILDIDEDRYNVLQSVGVDVEEYDETPGDETPGDETPGDETPGDETPGDETPGDETPGDETPGDETPGDETPGDETPGDETPGDETPGDETAKNVLIAAYKNDRNIVNELLADDLKTLCEAFGIDYTNVANAKEALKIVTIS